MLGVPRWEAGKDINRGYGPRAADEQGFWLKLSEVF
jgi:hypothetical protein